MKPARTRKGLSRKHLRGVAQIAVLTIVALLIGGFSIVGYQKYFHKDTEPVFLPTPGSETKNSPSPKESPLCFIPEGCPPETPGTTNWKTYTNIKYKFSFKHPNLNDKCCSLPGVAKDQEFEKIATFSDSSTVEVDTDGPYNGLSVSVITNPRLKTLRQIIDEEKVEWEEISDALAWSEKEPETEAGIVIDNQKGILVKNINGYGSPIIYVMFPNKKNVLVIAKSEDDKVKFIEFDQILSTFKFVN